MSRLVPWFLRAWDKLRAWTSGQLCRWGAESRTELPSRRGAGSPSVTDNEPPVWKSKQEGHG